LELAEANVVRSFFVTTGLDKSDASHSVMPLVAGILAACVLLAVVVLVPYGFGDDEQPTRGVPSSADAGSNALDVPDAPSPGAIEAYTDAEPNADELAKVDLQLVHAELFPQWLMSHSRDGLGEPSDETLARFDALRFEVSPDETLLAIVEDLGRIIDSDTFPERTDRARSLTRAWSRYLDRAGQPWLIRGGVMPRRRGPMLFGRFYRIESDVEIRVGGARIRAQLLRRTDQTNVHETYLGEASTGEGIARVVLDRVSEFAATDVWPMLDPNNEAQLGAVSRAFASAVRAEATDALSERHLSLLRETADARLALDRAIDAVGERTSCSGYRVSEAPGGGFGRDQRERIRELARETQGAECPAVTPEEAETIAGVSRRFHEMEGLDEAFAALTEFVARGVLVHEVQHVADADRNADERAPSCSGCPTRADARVRSEMSAYLASFAFGESRATMLFQACLHSDRLTGANAAALDIVIPELVEAGRCGSGPRDGSASVARDLHERYFGDVQPIVIPAAR
jgi:hypothetical protein